MLTVRRRTLARSRGGAESAWCNSSRPASGMANSSLPARCSLNRIAAFQAGKHIYVEKPCRHNPTQGALLVEAHKKYGKLVQMGTQQRSSRHTIEIVDKILGGIIGRPALRKPGTAMLGSRLGQGRKCRYLSGLTIR